MDIGYLDICVDIGYLDIYIGYCNSLFLDKGMKGPDLDYTWIKV